MRTLLRGGDALDGTGRAAVRADIWIEDGRIAGIGPRERDADTTIDCAGLSIAPGFIDGHSHSDLRVLEDRPEKSLQRVTTEVVGNCGFSAYPARPLTVSPSTSSPMAFFAAVADEAGNPPPNTLHWPKLRRA
jgi:N-acyl-D-aspartate/D-glutamate deacylase